MSEAQKRNGDVVGPNNKAVDLPPGRAPRMAEGVSLAAESSAYHGLSTVTWPRAACCGARGPSRALEDGHQTALTLLCLSGERDGLPTVVKPHPITNGRGDGVSARGGGLLTAGLLLGRAGEHGQPRAPGCARPPL